MWHSWSDNSKLIMRNWINTHKSPPITPVCQTPNSSSLRAWQHVHEPKCKTAFECHINYVLHLERHPVNRLVFDYQINYLISPSHQAFYCQWVWQQLACILLEDVDSHHHRNTKQVCYLDLLPEVATATTCSQAEILEAKVKTGINATNKL